MRRALVVVFAGMGATAALVPAVLPLLGASVGSSVVAAAPTLFGGLLVGVLGAPLLARWLAIGSVLRVAAVVQGVGLGVLAVAASEWVVFVAAGIAGVGFGLAEASGTAFAREVAGDGVARLLALLTATVAVVAAVSPLLVVLAGAGLFRWVLAAAAAAHLVAAVLVRAGHPERADAVERTRARGRVILVGVALFAYVGIESTLSGLSSSTVQVSLGTSAALAAVGTSAFWLLMTVGRLAGSAVLRAGARPWALAATAIAVIAVLLFVAAGVTAASPALALGLEAAAVFACGPCYALLIGAAAEWMTVGSTSQVSALIAVGAVGGTVIPATVIAAGGLRDAAWIPAAAGLLAVLCIGATRVRA
ncbi:MAG: hypothetical protein JWN36_1195 [Microbacteriaceae bacterium]|nr:hypothetical protein [Microbacteriaceae bacterium]